MKNYFLHMPAIVWEAICNAHGIGIILIEWRLLLWTYAFGKVLLSNLMPALIIIAALVFVVTSTLNIRLHHFHHHHHILRTIGGFIARILLAWVFLVMGVFSGGHMDRGRLTRTITYPVLFGRETYQFLRYSLHFLVGYGLYSFFERILTFVFHHVRFLNNLDRRFARYHIRVHLARLLGLLVIFWGIWLIPTDIA